jgi:hypothetical protein
MPRKHKLDREKPVSNVSKEKSGSEKRKKHPEQEEKTLILRQQASQFFKPKTTGPSDQDGASSDSQINVLF